MNEPELTKSVQPGWLSWWSVRLSGPSWWAVFSMTFFGGIAMIAIMLAIVFYAFPLTYEPGIGSSVSGAPPP